jgi:peptide/nickel transport system substrate-binding protein
MALDRKAIGDSLVKGPFTAIYPGGLSSGTSFYDRNSTVYYPFDLKGAKALLEKVGLKDTDGDGFVNFPADRRRQEPRGRASRQQHLHDRQEPRRRRGRSDGEARDQGHLNALDGPKRDDAHYGGRFDWLIQRNPTELASVVQNTEQLAPVGPRTSWQHRAGKDDKLDLMPYETAAGRSRQQVPHQPGQ